MEHPPTDLPFLSVGLDQDPGVVPVQFSHDHEAWPRTELGAAFFEEIDCNFWVRDDDCWSSPDPESEDGAVDAGPFFELDPW